MADNHHLASDWYGIDFRKHPELYRIGKGEQGVLTAEPYKSEILPFWRFKTLEIALKSSLKLRELYEQYKANGDIVGMDMTRKFVQMGWTRSRRYANHKSGKKYEGPVPVEKKGVSGAHGRAQLPLDIDTTKAECAKLFYILLQEILNDPVYVNAKKELKK